MASVTEGFSVKSSEATTVCVSWICCSGKSWNRKGNGTKWREKRIGKREKLSVECKQDLDGRRTERERVEQGERTG